MAEALHEDLERIFSLPMFVDLQVVFAMFLLCYVQHPSYLFHIMFPSLGILLHYGKFDTHTIIMLEKLFGVGFFGSSINHLACHHDIFLASLNRLGFPFVVQIIALVFLGCWAFIIFVIVIHFQHYFLRCSNTCWD